MQLTPHLIVDGDDAHAQEHSLEVQLPFLQAVLDDFRIVPFAVGAATPDEVADVIEDEIAAKSGIAPGMKIIAVKGRKFSSDTWHDALESAKSTSDPIELIVENTEFYRTIKLDYHQGEKYPHLMRDESRPDLLTEILKAK